MILCGRVWNVPHNTRPSIPGPMPYQINLPHPSPPSRLIPRPPISDPLFQASHSRLTIPGPTINDILFQALHLFLPATQPYFTKIGLQSSQMLVGHFASLSCGLKAQLTIAKCKISVSQQRQTVEWCRICQLQTCCRPAQKITISLAFR